MTTESAVYGEDNNIPPVGVDYYQLIEELRSSVFSAESKLEAAVYLLQEVLETDDADDLKDVVVRIKDFTETHNITGYTLG